MFWPRSWAIVSSVSSFTVYRRTLDVILIFKCKILSITVVIKLFYYVLEAVEIGYQEEVDCEVGPRQMRGSTSY